MKLPVFHIIYSFSPEFLHSVAEGVTKLVVGSKFDSKNHAENWYLGKKVDDVDNRLLNMKPPSELTRCPRSTKERALYKASEWKNFLIYYSLVCYKDLLPKNYYQHCFLFVYSIQIILKK